MDDYIKEVVANMDFSENKFCKINNMYITKEEKDVLEKYDINYNSCSDYKMLLYLIDDVLNNTYDECNDLEEVSISLSDRNYYNNTNK